VQAERNSDGLERDDTLALAVRCPMNDTHAAAAQSLGEYVVPESVTGAQVEGRGSHTMYGTRTDGPGQQPWLSAGVVQRPRIPTTARSSRVRERTPTDARGEFYRQDMVPRWWAQATELPTSSPFQDTYSAIAD
jgi:hypothetical protein